MRRIRRVILLAVLLAAAPVLAGCEDFDMDSLDVFGLNKKKPLPGERRDVFPGGVPGVTQGIPPEYLKSNVEAQQKADAAATAEQQKQDEAKATEDAQKKAAAAEEAAKPKPKPKKKVVRAPPKPPTQVTVQPVRGQNPQQAPWPNGGQQQQQPPQPQQSNQAPWPAQGQQQSQQQGQQQQDPAWSSPPPPAGTFSR